VYASHLPGLAEPADIRTVVAAIGAPLNVLALAGGRSVAELAELGVARISTGSLLFRAAVGATVQTALAVARNVALPAEFSGLPSYQQIVNLVGERSSRGG
jgi:2-methylisocitrate lyase-like PEP mutase family enzyme